MLKKTNSLSWKQVPFILRKFNKISLVRHGAKWGTKGGLLQIKGSFTCSFYLLSEINILALSALNAKWLLIQVENTEPPQPNNPELFNIIKRSLKGLRDSNYHTCLKEECRSGDYPRCRKHWNGSSWSACLACRIQFCFEPCLPEEDSFGLAHFFFFVRAQIHGVPTNEIWKPISQDLSRCILVITTLSLAVTALSLSVTTTMIDP